MIIKEISVVNFRNYETLSVSFKEGINIIYGENAQGKTNLLESIYFLGMTKSHRNFIDANLIHKDRSFFRIEGIIKSKTFDKKMEISYDNNRKKYKIDGNEEKKIHEYVTNMNLIIFYPEDLDLIKGGPEIRRRFLNIELGQLYSSYGKVLNDYCKLLKTRNDTLKKRSKKEYVDIAYYQVLTSYFINKAVLLYRMRKKFIDKLNEYIGEIFKDITLKEGFTIQYVPNIPITEYTEEEITKVLSKIICDNEIQEVKNGSSLYGPHRDDIEFYLNNDNLKKFGSQGQQRAAVLALKLSEIKLFERYKGEMPILLLDDVFSEFDDIKKNNLLSYIDSGIQTIITTTDLKNIDERILKKAGLFKVDNGKVTIIEEVE